MIEYRVCSNCRRYFNTEIEGIRLIRKTFDGNECYTYFCKKSCMVSK